MKRILPAALTGLIVCTLILSYLDLLNGRTGSDLVNRTFTAFNHSNPGEARNIFHFWQTSELRLKTVLQLIRLDYLLMIFYCSALFYILFQLHKNEQRSWIKNILKFGIGK